MVVGEWLIGEWLIKRLKKEVFKKILTN